MRMFEMPEAVAVMVGGEGMDAVVQQIEQVALDCGSIVVELFTVAGGALETKMGRLPLSWPSCWRRCRRIGAAKNLSGSVSRGGTSPAAEAVYLDRPEKL